MAKVKDYQVTLFYKQGMYRNSCRKIVAEFTVSDTSKKNVKENAKYLLLGYKVKDYPNFHPKSMFRNTNSVRHVEMMEHEINEDDFDDLLTEVIEIK